MVKKKRGVRKRVSKKKEVAPPRKMKMRHKQSWAIIGIFFLLSVMTIISLQEQEMSLTGNAVQTVGFIKAGSVLDFQVQGVPGLNDGTVTFSEDVRNGVIKFEENKNNPFTRPFYSKFTISSEDENKIASLKLNLGLEQTKLDRVPLSKFDVQLFQDGNPIETTMSEVKDGTVYYTATITSFGDFVIGKEEVVIIKAPVVKEVVVEPVVEETVIVEEVVVVKEEESGFFAWVRSLFE